MKVYDDNGYALSQQYFDVIEFIERPGGVTVQELNKSLVAARTSLDLIRLEMPTEEVDMLTDQMQAAYDLKFIALTEHRLRK